MTRTHPPAIEYLEAQVRTASPERLHLMVVDAALRTGRQGLAALEQGDRERSFEALSRCRACVSELIAAIKPEPDRELADRLRALFVFVHRQLTEGEYHRQVSPVRDALSILELHRETWLELLKQLPAERASTGKPQTSWVT